MYSRLVGCLLASHELHTFMTQAAYLLELIADIQLVWVKQQQNEVAPRSKPAAHINEVVGALYTLLLSRKHSWSVHQGDFLQQFVGATSSLKLG